MTNRAGDWWSRIGALVGLASAISYLMGAVVISEFARPFGLSASDLGLGVREYAIIAGMSVSAVVFIFGVLFTAYAVAIWIARLYLDRRQSGSIGSIPLKLMIGSGVLATAAVAMVAPAFIALDGPFFGYDAGNPYLTILAPFVLGLIVASSLDEYRERSALQPTFNIPTAFRAVREVLAEKPSRTLAMVALAVVLTTASSADSSASFSRRLLSGEAATTPLLLRYVMNPTNVCAHWRGDGPHPGTDRQADVTRVSRGGSGEVLIYDHQAWTVSPSEVLLSSSTC
jgi:hypothetical protein